MHFVEYYFPPMPVPTIIVNQQQWKFNENTKLNNKLGFAYFVIAWSIFLPSDNFSPESGGRVKSRTAIDEMSKQGTIRLKK